MGESICAPGLDTKTPRQREEKNKLVQELKSRLAQGEKDLVVEQMTPQKGSKNGDTLHGGITRQNWYHFVQNYLKFMKLDV